MHIDRFPQVPLVRIFSYIDDFSDKIALERVCKHWRQSVPLDWKITKTCRKPLIDRQTLGLVLNRCGECLEELWLQNININENMVNQMAKRMNCLKHLKLSFCRLDGPAMNLIADLFGQQLCSFIFDRTAYHPNMRRLIENDASKLEHLNLILSWNYSSGTLPTKLPNNLKSFSLHVWDFDDEFDFELQDKFNEDIMAFISNIARDCKNLKIFHLKIDTILPNMISTIGKIKSLVYLNLDFNSIQNEIALQLQNIICRELPNLKALRIGGYRCENLVLKKLIKEAIEGGNNPSFLDIWWKESN